MNTESRPSSAGMKENVAGLLCYLLGWITGLIFILIEKKNRFVRFHAMQSIIASVGLMIVEFLLPAIPVVGRNLNLLAVIGGIVLFIFLMIKAYRGEYFKLPVIGDMVEKNIG